MPAGRALLLVAARGRSAPLRIFFSEPDVTGKIVHGAA
jgi:hypothetical protein